MKIGYMARPLRDGSRRHHSGDHDGSDSADDQLVDAGGENMEGEVDGIEQTGMHCAAMALATLLVFSGAARAAGKPVDRTEL